MCVSPLKAPEMSSIILQNDRHFRNPAETFNRNSSRAETTGSDGDLWSLGYNSRKHKQDACPCFFLHCCFSLCQAPEEHVLQMYHRNSSSSTLCPFQIRINSVFREQRYVRQSQVVSAIVDRVRKDLIHQPLQLLSGVDVLGMTSSTLWTLSKGAAVLSKDGSFLKLRAHQVCTEKLQSMFSDRG